MARRFLNLYRHEIGREIDRLSEPVLEALSNYQWPGNVRELMNVIERAMLLCKTNVITMDDLPDVFKNKEKILGQSLFPDNALPEDWTEKSLPEIQKHVFDYIERMYLEMALKKTQGRIDQTARLAGIHPRGLYNKMKRYGLRKEDFKNRVN